MPVNRKPEINMAVELTPAFRDVLPGTVSYGCGGAVETLMDLVADPGAVHTVGELAKLGAVFSNLGAICTEASKGQAEANGIKEDDGVFFQVREPTTQTRVNAAYLKERFPAVNYPEMWQEIQVKGSITVDLPFKLSRLGER